MARFADRRQLLALVVSSILFVLISSQSQATQSTTIILNGGSLFTTDISLTSQLPGAGPQSFSGSNSGIISGNVPYSWSASALALAEYGVLKVAGHAEASGAGLFQTDAIATTRDLLTISNPSLTGQFGEIHASALIDAASFSNVSNGQASFFVTIFTDTSSWILLGLGCVGLAARLRRKI